jgi:hypothetical protein
VVGQHAVAQAAHAGHLCAGPSFSQLTFQWLSSIAKP